MISSLPADESEAAATDNSSSLKGDSMCDCIWCGMLSVLEQPVEEV